MRLRFGKKKGIRAGDLMYLIDLLETTDNKRMTVNYDGRKYQLILKQMKPTTKSIKQSKSAERGKR